jgi:hypothetical protein
VQELLDDAATLACVAKGNPNTKKASFHREALAQATLFKNQILALQFDATKGMEPDARILAGDTTLELRVCRLERVRTVCGCYKPPDGVDLSSALATLREWVSLALLVAGAFGNAHGTPGRGTMTTSPGAAAAWQTFVDTLHAGVSEGQVDYIFSTAPQKVGPTLYKLTREALMKVILPETVQGRSREELRQARATYLASISHSCAGRCFGITQNGKMGLFPDGVEIGDEVSLAAGAKVPFILREVSMVEDNRNERCFKLIGPAYISGIMYGDGMDTANEFEMIRVI